LLGGVNNNLYLISLSGFLVVGILAIILRWAYSSNNSLIERGKKIGSDDQYGLLKVAASPKNHIEGEMLRQKLLSVGIKATLSQTNTGPKILVFEKDYPISRQFRSAVFNRGTLSDIWQIGKNRNKKKTDDKSHGASFPEELVATILNNFSKPNDVIYDPFMGTGTTAVVAKKLNRRFIGSEILKDYCKTSQKRLKEVGDLI